MFVYLTPKKRVKPLFCFLLLSLKTHEYTGHANDNFYVRDFSLIFNTMLPCTENCSQFMHLTFISLRNLGYAD